MIRLSKTIRENPTFKVGRLIPREGFRNANIDFASGSGSMVKSVELLVQLATSGSKDLDLAIEVFYQLVQSGELTERLSASALTPMPGCSF